MSSSATDEGNLRTGVAETCNLFGGLVFTNISQQSMLSWIPYCIGESLEFVQKFYTVLKRSTTGARVRDGGGGVVLHKSFRIL